MIAERLTREELAALSVVCIVAFLFAFSFFSIHIGLPAIQKDFGSSLVAIQWISIVGNVLVSSLSLCMGRLGDIGGRKRLYRTGVALYGLGSGLCAFAGSFGQLVAFRVVMTLGLAMAFPLTGAILISKIHPSRRGRALGILGAAMALGRISGPTIGGMILAIWNWRGIFLTSAAIGVAATVAVWLLLQGEDQRKDEPFDLWGSIFLFVGYPALLLAMTLGPAWGWGSLPVLSAFVLSVAGWTAFVVTELHTEKPLIRPSFFRKWTVSVALLCLIVAWAVASPVYIFAPLYLQNVLRLPPLTVGLILTLPPLFIALLSPLSGWFADRFDGRTMVTVGLGFILVGIYCYSRSGPTTAYGWVGLTLILIGIGNGLFQPANQKVAFASVGEGEYGVVSAMLFSLGQAAGSLGTALAVALQAAALGGKEILLEPARFATAQQFAFAWLVPVAALGVVISLAERRIRFAPVRQ